MIRENAVLRRLYYRFQLLRADGQSDESAIIDRLAIDAPKTFVEIGFHPTEFNCIRLAKRTDWRGLLIDGSERQTEDARRLFSDRVGIALKFLTLDNLDIAKAAFPELGVLSIDVDGNDYWFLKELIEIKPALICIEYNSSFGLEPITIPYEATFDRHRAHPRGWYHGASLTALCKLCAAAGYGLAAVSEGGANAFFTRDGNLDPASAWRPNTFRAEYSGVEHDAQWEAVRDMPIIRV